MKPSVVLALAATVSILPVAGHAWSADQEVSAFAADESSSSLTIESAQVSLLQNAFIAAPMPGVIASVEVKEGDYVEEGTRLVLLDDQQAETELDAAKAALEAAKLASENDIDKRYAERTLEVRKRELRQSEIANKNYGGTVSSTEIEKLRLVVDQSELAIEQASHERLVARANAAEKQAAVRMAEERLLKHAIETTVAGMVTEVDVEPGEWVEAGKPIVRVISLDELRVECFVDGREHGLELVGHEVRFQVQHTDIDEASGVVTFVSPELHPVTGQARLWATIKNPELAIRAGMQGRLIVEKE